MSEERRIVRLPTVRLPTSCNNSLYSLSSFATMQERRLTLLPCDRFTPLLPVLRESLGLTGQSITAENFASLLDGTMRQLIHFAFQEAGANEGTIWLVEESTRTLVPAYNTGPSSERLVGRFKQPLSAGLISMVFASEQPYMENQVLENSGQDKSLDSLLRVQTLAMIAVPFYFLETCRGVVSCVQLRMPGTNQPAALGFDERDKARVVHAVLTLGRLIDYRLLQAALGQN